MSTATNHTRAPRLTTACMPFGRRDADDNQLAFYVVQTSINGAQALNEASCLLASVIGILNRREDDSEDYGIVALLEMVQGLVNAVATNASRE